MFSARSVRWKTLAAACSISWFAGTGSAGGLGTQESVRPGWLSVRLAGGAVRCQPASGEFAGLQSGKFVEQVCNLPAGSKPPPGVPSDQDVIVAPHPAQVRTPSASMRAVEQHHVLALSPAAPSPEKPVKLWLCLLLDDDTDALVKDCRAAVGMSGDVQAHISVAGAGGVSADASTLASLDARAEDIRRDLVAFFARRGVKQFPVVYCGLGTFCGPDGANVVYLSPAKPTALSSLHAALYDEVLSKPGSIMAELGFDKYYEPSPACTPPFAWVPHTTIVHLLSRADLASMLPRVLDFLQSSRSGHSSGAGAAAETHEGDGAVQWPITATVVSLAMYKVHGETTEELWRMPLPKA